MKITKINSKNYLSKTAEDKTDWKRVYQKPQSSVDFDVQKDKENPIIKNGKIRRLNGGTKVSKQ